MVREIKSAAFVVALDVPGHLVVRVKEVNNNSLNFRARAFQLSQTRFKPHIRFDVRLVSVYFGTDPTPSMAIMVSPRGDAERELDNTDVEFFGQRFTQYIVRLANKTK